jgi:hypothetical protein
LGTDSKETFYYRTNVAAKRLISTKYKDPNILYKNNKNLSKNQKTSIEKKKLELGIQYQLEMATIVVACLDKPESYDTLYYQNAVGSSLESIVAGHNKSRSKEYKSFEIREKRKLKVNSDGVSKGSSGKGNPESDPQIDGVKKEPSDKKGFYETLEEINTTITFKHMCEKILHRQSHISGNDDYLNKHYKADYKGRKVIAPISISSSCAAAAGYNTEEGVQGLLQELDPNVEELTLVRCDSVHIWTELQSKIPEAAANAQTNDEFDSFLKEIFEIDGAMEFVRDKKTVFFKK